MLVDLIKLTSSRPPEWDIFLYFVHHTIHKTQQYNKFKPFLSIQMNSKIESTIRHSYFPEMQFC